MAKAAPHPNPFSQHPDQAWYEVAKVATARFPATRTYSKAPNSCRREFRSPAQSARERAPVSARRRAEQALDQMRRRRHAPPCASPHRAPLASRHCATPEQLPHLERDVVLVDGVPLLQPQLLWPRACLSSQQLLEVAHRVVRVALYAHLLAQPVVAHHLNHSVEPLANRCARRSACARRHSAPARSSGQCKASLGLVRISAAVARRRARLLRLASDGASSSGALLRVYRPAPVRGAVRAAHAGTGTGAVAGAGAALCCVAAARRRWRRRRRRWCGRHWRGRCR